jgi:hypothetical protein
MEVLRSFSFPVLPEQEGKNEDVRFGGASESIPRSDRANGQFDGEACFPVSDLIAQVVVSAVTRLLQFNECAGNRL